MRAWIVCLVAACGDGASPAQPPPWEKTLPPSSVLGPWGGRAPARGIIHLHSPFSHDACDGMPRASDGTPNEPCLQSLRAALCADHIDYAALTDHDDSMADEDFATLFHPRPGDTPVVGPGGTPIASRLACDDGHTVLITVGGENELMPIMLDRHVPGTVAERHAVYDGSGPADVAAMRDAGARLWIPHTERHPIERLRAFEPDGIEVYNLHANIDPDIRVQDLGLPGYDAIAAAVEFADTNEGGPEPDLALLAFLTPNQPSLARWDELLADGRKVAGSAGSDAHENALPITLADGERGDSYRRTFRWFGNVVLADDPTDPVQLEAAIAAGRMFAVFELLGTPEGFSVAAGAATLGDTVAVGTTLSVTVPRVRALDPSLPAPTIRAQVVHVDAAGATVVATSEGEPIELSLARPGAYRVEVLITPAHLGPYLRDLGPAMAQRELPWIYASPVYVR